MSKKLGNERLKTADRFLNDAILVNMYTNSQESCKEVRAGKVNIHIVKKKCISAFGVVMKRV